MLLIAAFSRHDAALDWARDWAIGRWGALAMESSVEGAEILGTAGKWLLALAMAAIGLQVHLRSLLAVGARTVISASLIWLVLAAIVIATLHLA